MIKRFKFKYFICDSLFNLYINIRSKFQKLCFHFSLQLDLDSFHRRIYLIAPISSSIIYVMLLLHFLQSDQWSGNPGNLGNIREIIQWPVKPYKGQGIQPVYLGTQEAIAWSHALESVNQILFSLCTKRVI